MVADNDAHHPVPPMQRALTERALTVFDATVAAHGLAPDLRPDLALAAIALAAARQVDAPRPNLAGRDAVLAAPDPQSPVRRSIAASAVAFQRRRLRRRQEPAFLWLSSSDRASALRLSAILMLADALTALSEHDTRLMCAGKMTTLYVSRLPDGLVAGATPVERWEQFIGPLRIAEVSATTLEASGADEPVADTAPAWALLATWTPVTVPLRLHAGEPLAEGVRRVLRHQFERLLSREAAVRAGEDVEDIHQLRVATRRLRASLQVVAPCFDQRAIRRFRRGLRRLAAALGAVRDRDVFLEHLRHTQEALPAAEREQLTRLHVSVAQERATARQALLVRLDSPRYARFKEAFATFLSTPGAGVGPLPATGQPLRVRDLAGSLLWGRYEALRAFEPVLLAGEEVIQHEARIAGKRLRYTIECFAEAIGEAADALLEPLADLQEALGTLQDEVTARSTIESLHLRDEPGAQAYLAQRRTEREAALTALPEHWARVMGPAYRGQLLAVLEAF